VAFSSLRKWGRSGAKLEVYVRSNFCISTSPTLLIYTTIRNDFFSAMHGMPAQTSDEKGVCPSVCQTRALWQNGRERYILLLTKSHTTIIRFVRSYLSSTPLVPLMLSSLLLYTFTFLVTTALSAMPSSSCLWNELCIELRQPVDDESCHVHRFITPVHHLYHHFYYASLISSTPGPKLAFSINPSYRGFLHLFGLISRILLPLTDLI